MFIQENGNVVMRKKHIRNDKCDLLGGIKKSYDEYLFGSDSGVKGDIEYFVELLNQYINTGSASNIVRLHSIEVNDAVGDQLINETRRVCNKYYPVKITLAIGETVLQPVYLNVPFMDNRGVFIVQGKERVLFNELVKAEDISVESASIQLKTKNSSINFKRFERETAFITPAGTKVNLVNFAVYMACKAGLIDPRDDGKQGYDFIQRNFFNKTMRLMANKIEGTYTSVIYSDADKAMSYIDFSKQKLGKAREALDECFSLYRCVGRQLALPMGGYKAGTVLTEDIVDKLYEKKIKAVLLRYNPGLINMRLKETLHVTKIPKGTHVSSFLENMVPALAGQRYCGEDTVVNFVIENNTLIDEEVSNFLYDLNLRNIMVGTSKTGGGMQIPYAHEFKTNGKVHAHIYYNGNLPRHLSPYDWVEVSTGEKNDSLTLDDIFALVSFVCGTSLLPDVFGTLKRDADFLKSVNTVYESFSAVLRDVMRRYLRKRLSAFKAIIYKENATSSAKLQSEIDYMYSRFLSAMRERKLFRTAEFLNPASIVTQVRRVATILDSTHSANPEMIAILMAHFGRICPFDTPSGTNIGLLNSLAVRAVIEDRTIKTPYHRIISLNGKLWVDRAIVYLSPKEDYKYCIGDILMLENEDEGRDVYSSPIKEKILVARVPAVDEEDNESMVFESISTSELDYVNVYADQMLSVTSTLIPFIGADEGARILYATSMLRQAPPILHSEVPLVYTAMYKWIIDDSDFVVRAPKPGKVLDFNMKSIRVQYDDNPTVAVIPVNSTRIRNDSITIFDVKVSIGERFEKGHILADTMVSRDGFFSPGANLLVAYLVYYGYNHEDGLVISSKASEKFTSMSVNIIKRTFTNNTQYSYRFKLLQEIGTYISESSPICVVTSNDRMRRPPETIYSRHGKTGILYNVEKLVNDNDGSAEIVITLINFDELQPGDKMTGRHGNKGTVTLIEDNSKTPVFLNGVPIDILQNPCGIASRMNLGQEFEAHLGFCAYLLGLRIQSDSFNGADLFEIERLLKFCYDLSNGPDAETVIKNHPGFVPIIYQRAQERFDEIKKWQGCFNEDGTATLINNRTGKPFDEPVVIGCPYYIKLSHEVEHKRHERGGLTPDVEYKRINKQPPKGSSKGGGQASGEMENWALMGHGVSRVLQEVLNDRSDNVAAREHLQVEHALGEKLQPFDYDIHSSRSNEIFRIYSETIGAKIVQDGFGSSLDCSTIHNQVNYIENKELIKENPKDSNLGDMVDFLKNV
jgi:DNA-directed RNA polymerase beta subunit